MKKIFLLILLLSFSVQASFIFNGSGGGGASIGGAVVGGDNNSVLFVNPDGILAEDPLFTFVKGSGLLSTPSLKVSTLGLGLVHSDASGNFTSSLLVDADVSGSAAIAYSKLNLSNSILNSDINTSAAIAYSKLNLSNSILNSDVNASAAIDYSKLNLSGSIVNADVSGSAAIAYSKLNLTNSISDADVSTTAAITRTKTASGNPYRILVNNILGQMSENAVLTASRALASDTFGQLVASTATSTELGYLAGVTSSIQTQLNAKGTVSSVALSVPASSIFGVTGSPVTTTGTLGLTTTGTQGGVPYFSSTSQLATSAAGTSGQVLTSNGTGAPTWTSIAGAFSANNNTSLAGGGTIAIVTTSLGALQHWRVSSSGGQVTLSTTPFGTTDPVDRALICLAGISDSNPVIIPVSDIANGVVGNGDTTLGAYQTACFRYLSTEDRFVLESRSP